MTAREQRRDRTPVEWACLAIRMEERVERAVRIFGFLSRPHQRRLHFRNSAAQVAEHLGINPWGFIAEVVAPHRRAAFVHLHGGRVQ